MAKRRGNGEGSLRQRPNGTWEAAVMVGFNPVTGARNIKHFYSKTRAGAKQKMQDYLVARSRGLDMDSDYTVSEWLDIYLELHSKMGGIKPVTAENYKYSSAHIKKYLGEKKLKNIRPVDIERMLIELRENYSDSTLSKVRALMHSAFHKAVGNGLAPSNPVLYVSKIKSRQPNEKEIFTKEEVVRLFKALPNDRIGNSIRTLLSTGLRCQELLALTCDDIDPDGSKIRVTKAVTTPRGRVSLSTPKSFSSYRTVNVPSIAQESVRFLRDTPNKYIWQSPTGEVPINPSCFRKHYKNCLESIENVRYLPVHNCRHSYVSFLQAVGVDLATVKSLAGHHTASMSLHYTHVIDSTKENAVEKLTTLFSNV